MKSDIYSLCSLHTQNPKADQKRETGGSIHLYFLPLPSCFPENQNNSGRRNSITNMSVAMFAEKFGSVSSISCGIGTTSFI